MAAASTSNITFPQMTAAEEDSLIHSRLMNDERALRRLARRFHTYAEAEPAARAQERDLFIDDLAAFQSTLATRALICEAEARQVVLYEEQRKRIEAEQHELRDEIVHLKAELEVEQVHRKRKLEYDQIAEKVNLFAPRSELEQSISALEEEIASIEAQLDAEKRAMVSRQSAFDHVVSELQVLRLMGKEPEPEEEAQSRSASPEHEREHRGDDDDDDPRRKRSEKAAPEATPPLNPSARPFKPRLISGLGTRESSMAASSPVAPSREEGEEGAATDGDVEMGEVAEPQAKPTRVTDELEEGEASPMTPLSTVAL
ncbi:hypothetical protein AURDEDRAFT_112872 [Auricularia subglabra TFB-10046 SS5]|nr:hypothetical protein AURDEDRAFT_112872 [Auricularia subglabra TFB-10046 SS5]